MLHSYLLIDWPTPTTPCLPCCLTPYASLLRHSAPVCGSSSSSNSGSGSRMLARPCRALRGSVAVQLASSSSSSSSTSTSSSRADRNAVHFWPRRSSPQNDLGASWQHRRSMQSAAAAGAGAAADPPSNPTSNSLVDWVVGNGGSVNGVAMANLTGSDGGSGWGLVATQVGFCGWVLVGLVSLQLSTATAQPAVHVQCSGYRAHCRCSTFACDTCHGVCNVQLQSI